MLEFYQAYATYEDLIDLTEEMISSICEKVNGTMQITYQGTEVDLSPPWARLTMDEALVQVAGIEDRIRESGDQALLDEVASRRNEVRALEEQYDRFLEELDVLGSGLSEEDRVILRVARLFGECELTMPDDFVAEVKRYIHEWKLSPRLRTAVARMEWINVGCLCARCAPQSAAEIQGPRPR